MCNPCNLELAEITRVSQRDAGLDIDIKSSKYLVRAACGSLLKILPDETVSVIHHSFTEYLKGSSRLHTPGACPVLLPGDSHGVLVLACLGYLRSIGTLYTLAAPKDVLHRPGLISDPTEIGKSHPIDSGLGKHAGFMIAAPNGWGL
jgi:hypothetical protein